MKEPQTFWDHKYGSVKTFPLKNAQVDSFKLANKENKYTPPHLLKFTSPSFSLTHLFPVH